MHAIAVNDTHVALARSTEVLVWSLASLESLRLPGEVTADALAFGPGGQLVVAERKTLQRWSLAAGTPALELELRPEPGVPLAVAADADWIAAATDRGSFERWSDRGEPQLERTMAEISPVRWAAISEGFTTFTSTAHRSPRTASRCVCDMSCTCSRHSTIEWRVQSRSTAAPIPILERRGGEKIRRSQILDFGARIYFFISILMPFSTSVLGSSSVVPAGNLLTFMM